MKFLWVVLFLVACARAPLKDPALAFRAAEGAPELADTLPLDSLREALKRTLAAYTNSNVPSTFRFAEREVSKEDYQRALLALEPELESVERFHAFVRENFEFYEVYGADDWGEVFATGYYDPTMKGSPKRTEKFSEPLYRTPPDMVVVDLAAYAAKNPDLEVLKQAVIEQKSRIPIWRGRLVKAEEGVPKVIPFYERAEIVRDRPLAGKGLELAWVDPIDAFYLEIQGSGVVELPGKKIRVGYDSQNGFPYVAIGKFLTDVIPLEEMSMQRIRAHLETLPRQQQQEIFDKNPSYVFFRKLKGLSLTFSGAEVTAGRTIASDQLFFPKGTLAFLEMELPVFPDATAAEPTEWVPRPRWVFDQDTGGAIRGGGRIDLYMGDDTEAARMAGVMKRKGKMWYLAPKESFLARIR